MNSSLTTTREGKPRGYIEPTALKDLWIHLGTNCNLNCSMCYEGSHPGSDRIQSIRFEELKPFLDEAVSMGAKSFCFTGGEPFVNRDFIRILDYALERLPCLVLTNGTQPMQRAMDYLCELKGKPQPLAFRISLDASSAKDHDSRRGIGSFAKSLNGLNILQASGFEVSVARLALGDFDEAASDAAYAKLFGENNLPEDLPLVTFTDLRPPCDPTTIPEITTTCMTTYCDDAKRASFMCSSTRMVVKKSDSIVIFACTLVDDDDGFIMGTTLAESFSVPVVLSHHRCFTCFSAGVSCGG